MAFYHQRVCGDSRYKNTENGGEECKLQLPAAGGADSFQEEEPGRDIIQNCCGFAEQFVQESVEDQ